MKSLGFSLAVKHKGKKMSDKRIYARNTNTSVVYNGPMNSDFISDPIDFRNMSLGFIQVIYGSPLNFLGSFRLLVSSRLELETFVYLDASDKIMDITCPGIGWNLCCIGYRFVRVQYFANGQGSDEMEIIACGKKG